MIYLKPGTALTTEPSRCNHEIIGMGLPCAVQVTCVPVSFPNKILKKRKKKRNFVLCVCISQED